MKEELELSGKYYFMDTLNWRKSQLLMRLYEKQRRVGQYINKPNLSILGAFHGGNVGDNVLGLSIANFVKSEGLTYGLQNIYNISAYPKTSFTICAGGATGVISNMKLLANRNDSSSETTALIGMDFSSDVSDFPEDILNFLTNVRYISCRSKVQATNLSSILNRNDIKFELDNAFSYSFPKHSVQSNLVGMPKVLGFNTLPFFVRWVKGKGFLPGTDLESFYKKNNSDIYEYITQLGTRYIEFIQKNIDIYISRGWKVVHIPFTFEDHIFAKTFFQKDGVDFLSFNPSPNKTFLSLANCDRFLSTRYHSLIFSLIARVPCIPFLYSAKCSDLLFDLDSELKLNYAIDRLEIIHSFDHALEKSVNPKPYILSTKNLELIYNAVSNNIYQAVKSIQI